MRTPSLPFQAFVATPTRSLRRAGWLARATAALGAAIQASGRARARNELLSLAEACAASQPQLAAELRAAGAALAGR